MEGSQMVVMAVEASNSLLTGVFTLSPLWPVSGNPQHLLLVEISMWLKLSDLK
jgi:hypothetical protein